MARRHELTDEQWERIRDRVPGKRGDPGRTGRDDRRFAGAVFFVLRTGVRWVDLPERLGSFETRKKRFYRWAKAGVRERVYRDLLAGGEDFDLAAELEEPRLDSTSVKARPNAAAGRREPGETKRPPTTGAAWAAAAGA